MEKIDDSEFRLHISSDDEDFRLSTKREVLIKMKSK